MYKDYNDYFLDKLLEEFQGNTLTLYYSDKFRNILADMTKVNNNIAIDLMKLENREKAQVTYIDLDNSGSDKVSYINSPKAIEIILNDGKTERDDISQYTTDSDVYKKFRNIVSVGKLVKKLFSDKYEASGKPGTDIESFVNLFKSIRTSSEFKIIKGYEIIKWYNEENYSKFAIYNTRLGGSCMRHDYCDDYIEFYAKNKKSVSLLILMDNINKTKIKGRALIWELTVPENRIFMDRIYTTFDSDIELFKKYAIEKNWLYKEKQTPLAYTPIVDTLKNITSERNMLIKNINNHNYYPFMDTFKYYDIDNGILTNDKSNLSKSYYFLESMSGEYEILNVEGIFVPYYGETFSDDELVWCEYGDEYRLNDDAIWLYYYDGFATKQFIQKNMIECNNHIYKDDGFRFKEDRIYLDNYKEWATNDVINDPNYFIKSKKLKIYLKVEDAVWSDYYDSYIDKKNSVKVIIKDKPNITEYRIKADNTYFEKDGKYYDIKNKK
jgi:hypothetical protein